MSGSVLPAVVPTWPGRYTARAAGGESDRIDAWARVDRNRLCCGNSLPGAGPPIQYSAVSFDSVDTTCARVLYRPDGVLSSASLAHKAAEAPHHEVRGYPAGHSDMYHGTVRDQVAAGPVRVLVTPPIASAGGY